MFKKLIFFEEKKIEEKGSR